MSRNSDLILNLLSLMSSSPALRSSSPSSFVRERLRLDLSERDAVRHVDHLVHLSSSAVVASVVERLHRIAQAIRS